MIYDISALLFSVQRSAVKSIHGTITQASRTNSIQSENPPNKALSKQLYVQSGQRTLLAQEKTPCQM